MAGLTSRAVSGQIRPRSFAPTAVTQDLVTYAGERPLVGLPRGLAPRAEGATNRFLQFPRLHWLGNIFVNSELHCFPQNVSVI